MLEQVLDKIGEPGVTVAAASPNSFAEEELVAAAKSGDEGAFETLFKRHQRRMLAFARRYTRVREDAEDVVQQTFQKAFIHLNKFQGKSSFSTWLTRIAINEALMLVRRGRALREIPVDDSSDHGVAASALETLDASPDPETSYLRRERVQILSETLANLQPGLRLAVALRELAELSTEETARLMGISVAAVKARLFHARRKLAKTIRCYMRSRRTCESDIRAAAGSANRNLQNRMTCNA
jgi:RNA polymerase sigma-70 factor, ECF subfamily